MKLSREQIMEMVHAVSFVIGGVEDPDLSLKIKDDDKPSAGIPDWSTSKRDKYLNIWKDIKFDQMGDTGVARLLIISKYRAKRYDKPKYFQINDYGIFEFRALSERKELIKRKESGTGEVKSEDIVQIDSFSHKWEVSNSWPFFCQDCGREKRKCVCDQVYLLSHLSMYQADDRFEPVTCDNCSGLVVPELYEYETENGEPRVEVMWLCEDCEKRIEVNIDLVEKVHREYGDDVDGNSDNM